MQYVETHSTDPCYNLAFEEYLLENHTSGSWLMLWQNDKTVVVGRNQNTLEEISADFVLRHNISVVRRITGGGAVFHDLQNLNYSFITDVGDASALSISRFTDPICRALEKMGVHAELNGRNDILVDGKKVSGFAQRVCKNRILHHGTLLFKTDSSMISGALNVDPSKFTSKGIKSVRSRVGKIWDYLPEKMDIDEFRSRLLYEIAHEGFEYIRLPETELAAISALADSKYRTWEWTYGLNSEFSFRNKARFNAGSIEVCINSVEGKISEIDFSGDYMAITDDDGVKKALLGQKLRPEAVSAALGKIDLQPVFGGISKEEILSLIFPN